MNKVAWKLCERLGEKEWLRPKGMHQTTFDRLRARLIEAEMMADDILYTDTNAWLERIKRLRMTS